MSPERKSRIAELLDQHEKELLASWIDRTHPPQSRSEH